MINDTAFTFKTPVKQDKMDQMLNPMTKFGQYEDEEIIGDWNWNKQLEGVQQIAVLFPSEKLAATLDAQGKINAIADCITYDPADTMPTDRMIRNAQMDNDKKALNHYERNAIGATRPIVHENLVRTFNHPDTTVGDKIVVGASDYFVQTNSLIQMGEDIETGFPPPPGAVAVAGWVAFNAFTAGIPAMIDLAHGSPYAQEALESNY